jgi:hypothetical protein
MKYGVAAALPPHISCLRSAIAGRELKDHELNQTKSVLGWRGTAALSTKALGLIELICIPNS